MPDFVRVDIEKYRKDRQLETINLVFEHIFKSKKIIESSNLVNLTALNRVYQFLGKETVSDKSISDENFAKILSMYISKSSTRQGSNDEAFVLDTIKKFMLTLGVDIEKSKTNSLVPIKSGTFVGQLLHRDDVTKNRIPKTDCLKSIDCLLTENSNIIGYGFLKVCFGVGGHQDNVIFEASDFVEWAIKFGDKDKLYLVIIDSDHSKISHLKNKTSCHENIWVVDHYDFQVKFYDWYTNRNK